MNVVEFPRGGVKASRENVLRAADRILMSGQRPTQRLVMAALGGGSPNSITEYLEDWYRVLGERMQAAEHPIEGLPGELVGLMREIWRVALVTRDPTQHDQATEANALEQSLRAEVMSLKALNQELRQQLRGIEQRAADARALALRLEANLRDDRAERERLQTELAVATQELEVTRTRFALSVQARTAVSATKAQPTTKPPRSTKRASISEPTRRPKPKRSSPRARQPKRPPALTSPRRTGSKVGASPRAAKPRLTRSGRRRASSREARK